MNQDITSLPPLPDSIQKIQQLCMMNDVDISQLTKVIESDPMLSANILKSVNSPLYGMSKEIASIRQAVMMFGISMIRGFAAANAIKKSFVVDLSPYRLSIERLSSLSAMQLALVREWYGSADKTKLPLLTSAAFLMELGKLVASKRVIVAGEASRFTAEIVEGKPIQEIEKCYLGRESYEIAARMFEHWNFDNALIESIDSIAAGSGVSNEYGAVLRAVARAINVRDVLTDASLQEAYTVIDEAGLDKQAFVKAVEYLKNKMDSSGAEQ